ncbi:MAG TPA: thioredoxin domain-containing protein [Candidatus Lokiarchaeia archaeon]|nr:thioredoxin domain-containing protein [Candidatus Lokiarchaeia archaeon]
MSNLLHLESSADFKGAIIDAGETPIMCDIWAPWCGPCKLVGPLYEELAGEFEGEVIFTKLNADGAGDVLRELGVLCVPTFLLFQNGNEVSRLKGACDKRTLVDFINQALPLPQNGDGGEAPEDDFVPASEGESGACESEE